MAENTAPAARTASTTSASTPATTTEEAPKTIRTVAQFTGHAGTRRIIDKKAQDSLTGVKGSSKEDLVWEAGNRKVDVTDVQPDVLEYLEKSDEFKITKVEVSA